MLSGRGGCGTPPAETIRSYPEGREAVPTQRSHPFTEGVYHAVLTHAAIISQRMRLFHRIVLMEAPPLARRQGGAGERGRQQVEARRFVHSTAQTAAWPTPASLSRDPRASSGVHRAESPPRKPHNPQNYLGQPAPQVRERPRAGRRTTQNPAEPPQYSDQPRTARRMLANLPIHGWHRTYFVRGFCGILCGVPWLPSKRRDQRRCRSVVFVRVLRVLRGHRPGASPSGGVCRIRAETRVRGMGRP